MTPTKDRLARLDQYVAKSLVEYRAMGMNEQQCAELEVELRLERIPEWMGYRDAQFIVMSLHTSPDYEGFTRDEIMNANRTSVTATMAERTALVSANMGVDPETARTMVEAILNGSDLPPEPVAEGEGECALYRHFDSVGVLLYIGIAVDPRIRRSQHARSSSWFRFADHMEAEWFASREDAEAAERLAIAAEMPVFNGTHNKANRDAALAYLFGALEGATS